MYWRDKMKTVKWGVLGTATIAKKSVIPGIMESSLGELHGIASRTQEAAEKVATAFSIPNAYGSYEALLADPEIDAVYIPLPNHLHKEWVQKAAAAKKHILCEKPLALDAKEVEDMMKACEEANVLLVEAFMYRHQLRYKQILTDIENGEIGELRGIRAAFSFNNSGDYQNFRMKRENGGGSLFDVGVYPLSLARMIFGEEPNAVTTHSFTPATHDYVDMVTAGLVEFPNGKFLTFDCGMWSAFRNEVEILGTDGRIEIANAFTGGSEGYDLFKGDEVIHKEVNDTNHYAKQADQFVRAVWGEEAPLFSSEDSLKNQQLLDACMKSQQSQTRISLGGH